MASRDDGSWADEIVDELLPEKLEWRRVVRDYPLAAVLLAGVGGFFLGRARGEVIASALAAFALREVTENIESLLAEEAEEPAE